MVTAPKSRPHEAALSGVGRRRPAVHRVGKAVVAWEETGKSTTRAAGVQAQASSERSAEITSGRAIYQQGLTATCKDPPNEDESEGGGRDLVWRMSSYERGRRGNAHRGDARHSHVVGNAGDVRRSSGHLADPGRVPDTEPGVPDPRSRGEPVGKLQCGGVYACQRLSLPLGGKTFRGNAKVRTGLGKSDRPGSQGGPGKRGTWQN